jgi:hypothetical protein
MPPGFGVRVFGRIGMMAKNGAFRGNSATAMANPRHNPARKHRQNEPHPECATPPYGMACHRFARQMTLSG